MTIDLGDPTFDAATCPECGIVLREATKALRCPECGWSIQYPDVIKPPDFDGPGIHGG